MGLMSLVVRNIVVDSRHKRAPRPDEVVRVVVEGLRKIGEGVVRRVLGQVEGLWKSC